MEADRESKATLVDLLDRILDKGVIVNADAIVSLAGIPLIGIQLNALVASVDTMLSYGMWQEWDAALRASATMEYNRKKDLKVFSLGDDETRISEFPGSYWCTDGISGTWKAGRILLTNKRMIIYRTSPPEILIDIGHNEIVAASVDEEKKCENENVRYIDLELKSGRIVKIISSGFLLHSGLSDAGWQLKE
jgi:hypothetical protein